MNRNAGGEPDRAFPERGAPRSDVTTPTFCWIAAQKSGPKMLIPPAKAATESARSECPLLKFRGQELPVRFRPKPVVASTSSLPVRRGAEVKARCTAMAAIGDDAAVEPDQRDRISRLAHPRAHGA